MSFLGSLGSSFSGKGAEEQLQAGRNSINKNKTAAQGYYTGGEANALQYQQPWLNRGGRNYYDATLGINPNMSANDANKAYFGNQALQDQVALQQKQRGWMSNSRGGYGGGADALAAARVNQENYGNWQNRLADVASGEERAANTASGISQWGAAGRAGAEMGAMGANTDLYKQSALNSNTLAQNTMGLGTLAAKAAAAYMSGGLSLAAEDAASAASSRGRDGQGGQGSGYGGYSGGYGGGYGNNLS